MPNLSTAAQNVQSAMNKVSNAVRKENIREKATQTVMGSFEDIIQIVLAQVKNQNPGDPVKPHVLAQTLSTQAGLLGTIENTEAMREMAQASRDQQLMTIANQVGKVAEFDSDTFYHGKDNPCEISYNLPPEAKFATIDIFSEEGQMVASRLVEAGPGLHKYAWDGLPRESIPGLDDPKPSPKGVYSFSIKPLDERRMPLIDPETEELVDIPTTVKGRVTGAVTEDENTLVSMSGAKMPMSSLKAIYEDGRKIKPKIIQDEKGHKAYKKVAQNPLVQFNKDVHEGIKKPKISQKLNDASSEVAKMIKDL